MIKDLVPQAMRPTAKKLQRETRAAVRGVKAAVARTASGSVLAEASLADGHALTVLVSSREEVDTLSALCVSRGVSTEHAATERLRYRRDGRAFLLASFVLTDAVVPGTTIQLSTDRGEVALMGAIIRETRDKTYPLIDRLVLTSAGGALHVVEGQPRAISSPVLLGATWSDELAGVVVNTNLPLSGARVHLRDADDYVPLLCTGTGFVLPADFLAEVCATDSQEPVLLRPLVTSGTMNEGGVTHGDPWVRIPRNYETFEPILAPVEGRTISVRPYWTLGGALALKVRNK